MFCTRYYCPIWPTRRTERTVRPIVAVLLILIILWAWLSMPGCQATLTAGTPATQPDPLRQTVDVVAIAGAKTLVTSFLSPRIEQAYAQGKITKPVYLAARDEETAALTALDGLQTRLLAGQPVTQADLDATKAQFLAPLVNLATSYVGPTTLPAPQP